MRGYPLVLFGAIEATFEITTLSSILPLGLFFLANSSIQGWKFENSLDGPNQNLMVSTNAKFLFKSLPFSVNAEGGLAQRWGGVISYNLKTSVIRIQSVNMFCPL